MFKKQFYAFLFFYLFGYFQRECYVNSLIYFVTDLTVCDPLNVNNLDLPDNLELTIVNETFSYISGKIEFKKVVNENMILSLQITLDKIIETGGYERVTLFELPNFCDEIENKDDSDDSVAATFIKKIVDLPDKCPLNPGTYNVENMSMDIPEYTKLPFGKYAITIKFIDTPVKNNMPQPPGTEYGCIYGEVIIDQD